MIRRVHLIAAKISENAMHTMTGRVYLHISFLLCLFLAPDLIWAQDKTQSVRGTVLDKESQTPLIGANVQVQGSDPLIGSSTDVDGKFHLRSVPIGRQTLLVTYLGYEPAIVSNILIIAGKELVLDLELTESTIRMEEVVVRANDGNDTPINEMAMVSARQFSVEETSRYAASLYDPARMALNFAGVSVTGGTEDLLNEIVVRGNSPRGVIYRMEGVEIPNPNHFSELGNTGGGISMLSSSLLSNSDFYTGAFPAEFGNALSGAFDLNLRKGNNENREYALMLGVLGIEVAGEGPIGEPGGASYLLNFRYSTLALLQAAGFSPVGDALPEYGDLAFNINVPTKSIGNFNLFGLIGKNRAYFDPEPDQSGWEDFDDNEGYNERQTTGMIGLAHKLLLTDNSYLRTVLLGSVENQKDDEYFLNPDLNYRKIIYFDNAFNNTMFRLSSTYTQKLNAQHTFKFGGILSHHKFDFFARDFNWRTNQYFIYLENDGGMEQYQAFAQWKYRPGSHFTMTGGVHYNYFGLNQHSSLEPRIAMEWTLDPGRAVNFAAGLHSKPEHPSFYFAETTTDEQERISPNQDLDYIKAYHLVLGYKHRLSEALRLRAEIYYQYLTDVAVSEGEFSKASILNALEIWDVIDGNPAEASGKGKNYGIDLTLEKSYGRQYYFLLTGSVFTSRFRTIEGDWFNTRFNSGYQVNLIGGKEWSAGKSRDNIFGLNGRFVINGGNRMTPIDLEESRRRGYTVRDYSDFLGSSVGTYGRLDLGISYKINRSKLTHTLMLDIQNVTNRLNPLYGYYNRTTQNIDYDTHTGLLPILNYRVEF